LFVLKNKINIIPNFLFTLKNFEINLKFGELLLGGLGV